MKKYFFLIIALLFVCIGAEAQAYKQHFEVPTRTTLFGTTVGSGMTVIQKDSGYSIVLGATFQSTDNLQSVFTSGNFTYPKSPPIKETTAVDTSGTSRRGDMKMTRTALWVKTNTGWRKISFEF